MEEKEVRKFDNKVEEYIKNKNIYKNNWEYLITSILKEFARRMDIVEKSNFNESLVHEELDILDCTIEMCSKYCTNSIRRDLGIDKKLEVYFEDIRNYVFLRNAFTLKYNNLMDIDIKKSNVELRYKNINLSQDVLNYENRLKYGKK